MVVTCWSLSPTINHDDYPLSTIDHLLSCLDCVALGASGSFDLSLLVSFLRQDPWLHRKLPQGVAQHPHFCLYNWTVPRIAHAHGYTLSMYSSSLSFSSWSQCLQSRQAPTRTITIHHQVVSSWPVSIHEIPKSTTFEDIWCSGTLPHPSTHSGHGLPGPLRQSPA